MNPFQKAEQAAKEAAERRQRGNAARANAWSGERYRERIKKSNEDWARYGGRPKPGRPRTAKPGIRPRTAKPTTTKPQNNFNFNKWFKNTFKNRQQPPNNQWYKNTFKNRQQPPPQSVITNNINNALRFFNYLSKNNMKSQGPEALKKKYFKLAFIKHPNRYPKNQQSQEIATKEFQKLGGYYNKLKQSFPKFTF